MEHQLWKEIIARLRRLNKRRPRAREAFTDLEILEVHWWAVVHDRPMSWACKPVNWPIHRRRRKLPSDSTVSRRMRTASILTLLAELDAHVRRPASSGLVWLLDGKPLVISGISKDRQAGYGRAACSKAKGYKLHALIDAAGGVAEWRVAPMNKDERVMAARMLRVAEIQGYVVTDANYDSNPLHGQCDERGNLQLVAPRRYGAKHGHGHRRQTAGRLRAKEILENPMPWFGRDLLRQRTAIERFFGNLTNWGGGLTHLPPWVRTYRRVHRWVQAKLIATRVRRELLIRT